MRASRGRRLGGGAGPPPEYLDEAEQAAIIARFEASMRRTREAWLSRIAWLSVACGVGVFAAYALALPFLPKLMLKSSFGARASAAASDGCVGVAAAAASVSFCLPAAGLHYARSETRRVHRWLAAGAAVPLCAFLGVLAWSRGATVPTALLFPVFYQGFCLLAIGVLHEPDASLASLRSAQYHHKKA
jgi:hypothetical protein